MAIGDNIKKLRTALNMTQQQFADEIKMKQNSIALIENNKRNISEQAILTISLRFNVRWEWLMTGEGEMYDQSSESILRQLSKEFNRSEKSRELIKVFLNLPQNVRDLVSTAVANAAANYPREQEEKSYSSKSDGELTQEEAMAKVGEEYAAKEAAAKRGAITSSASTTSSGLSKKIGTKT